MRSKSNPPAGADDIALPLGKTNVANRYLARASALPAKKEQRRMSPVEDLAVLNPSLVPLLRDVEAIRNAVRLHHGGLERVPQDLHERLAGVEAAIRDIRAENKICDAERMALRADLENLKLRLLSGNTQPNTEPSAPPPP